MLAKGQRSQIWIFKSMTKIKFGRIWTKFASLGQNQPRPVWKTSPSQFFQPVTMARRNQPGWFWLSKSNSTQIRCKLLQSHGKLACYVLGRFSTGIRPITLYIYLRITTYIGYSIQSIKKWICYPFSHTLSFSNLYCPVPFSTTFFSVLGGLADPRATLLCSSLMVFLGGVRGWRMGIYPARPDC